MTMRLCGHHGSLYERQKYSLQGKIFLSKIYIQKWYEHFKGNVYVSFSGGKDSTVLLHLVRSIYPDVPAVYCDTGMEYPEIRNFVKSTPNVIWIKPTMPFNKVLEKYGYPIISKEQSQYIDQWRSTNSQKIKNIRWNGNANGRGKISEKWKYLVDAPFKISDKCCEVMKKRPFRKYEKETEQKPFLGIMAVESSKRTQEFNRFGCNAFECKRPISRPLFTWLEEDIWKYLRSNNIAYCSIYDMGYERTGCMFCLFGHHISKVDRMSIMQKTHPKQYAYCMNKLNFCEIFKWYPDNLSI